MSYCIYIYMCVLCCILCSVLTIAIFLGEYSGVVYCIHTPLYHTHG